MKKNLLLIFLLFSIHAFPQLQNGALYFDGVDDVVTIPNTYSFSSTDNFTVEAWIRANTQPVFPLELNIVSNREDFMGTNGFRVSVNNGNLTYFGVNGGLGAGPNLLDSVCHHVAVVRQNSFLYFYVDGILHSSSETDTTDINSTEPYLFIGAKHDPQFPNSFHGLIKEVRLWNIARTGTQIQNNMNTIIAAQPNLAGYWRCDDSTGQTVQDYANGNDGILGNSPATDTSDPLWISGCASFPTSVENNILSDAVQIYPNPVSSELNIEINLPGEPAEFILYDYSGRILMRHVITKNSTLQTGMLSRGLFMYVLKRNGIPIDKGIINKH